MDTGHFLFLLYAILMCGEALFAAVLLMPSNSLKQRLLASQPLALAYVAFAFAYLF